MDLLENFIVEIKNLYICSVKKFFNKVNSELFLIAISIKYKVNKLITKYTITMFNINSELSSVITLSNSILSSIDLAGKWLSVIVKVGA